MSVVRDDQTGVAIFARCSRLWPEQGELTVQPLCFGNRRYIAWRYTERGEVVKEGVILLAAFLNIEAAAWASILGDGKK